MIRRRVKKSNKGWIFAFILVLIGAGVAYVYFAKEFERVPPTVQMPKYEYWNTKTPLKIKLSDSSGLRTYRAFLSDGTNEVRVVDQAPLHRVAQTDVSVTYPRGSELSKDAKRLTLRVEVSDKSLWGFAMGNHITKRANYIVESEPPIITILANSHNIKQGGSALVVFRASDNDKIVKTYIRAGNRDYQAQPYKKEGYYAALFAWPFREEHFDVSIVAEDRAGNRETLEIPLAIYGKPYQSSWIEASDSFIDGKITDLAMHDDKYMKKDRLERLKAINETMRIDNEILIHKYSYKVSDQMLHEWKVEKFNPLKNAEKVASFGDDRHYYYQDKEHEISQSYHLGYDMASTSMAPLTSSNAGTVVYVGYNGIYGNMPIIDHGLGLYTLYGHCAMLHVKEGQRVKAGERIAQTGKTGLALGDHLHFGILIQGVEVRPIEWIDANWVDANINNIFKKADAIIEPKSDENSTKVEI